jgi:hypothetical protein
LGDKLRLLLPSYKNVSGVNVEQQTEQFMVAPKLNAVQIYSKWINRKFTYVIDCPLCLFIADINHVSVQLKLVSAAYN